LMITFVFLLLDYKSFSLHLDHVMSSGPEHPPVPYMGSIASKLSEKYICGICDGFHAR
jgi:hypothetical protein